MTGKRVTINDIPALVNEALLASMVPRNILPVFRSTGCWPFNPDIFGSADFAAASVTDKDFVEFFTESVTEAEPDATPHIDQEISADEQSASSSSFLNITSFVESIDQPLNEVMKINEMNSSYLSPASILPFPKISPRKKSNRRRGKIGIYIDTPVKDEMEKKSLKKK